MNKNRIKLAFYGLIMQVISFIVFCIHFLKHFTSFYE